MSRWAGLSPLFRQAGRGSGRGFWLSFCTMPRSGIASVFRLAWTHWAPFWSSSLAYKRVSSSSLSLLSPPVSAPASRSLSVSFDSSTLMVGVLGLLLLLGSRPLRRPPGRFGGVLIRSAVRAAANSFAPSYNSKSGDTK